MIPALPLVGKMLVDLVASGASAVLSPQGADAKKLDATATSGDFTQAVDDLQRTANPAITHGAHGTARS